MKKTTIALLTAAAMGTSGAVMAADHSPEFSGRVNLDIQNIEGESTSFTRGNADRFEVSGTGDLAAGMTGRYFLRLERNVASLVEDDNDKITDVTGGDNFTKAFYAVSGEFGEVLFGRDDDIVFKFVGVRTDVPYANIGGAVDSATGSDTTQGSNVSLQYQLSVDALTFGAYVDTAGSFETAGPVGEDQIEFDRDGDGFTNYQLGVQGDFGMASAGLVYSDSEYTGRDSELALGVTLDLDVATISATVRDDSQDNTPVSVFGALPLQNGVTAYAAYGDDDDGSDNYLLGLSADLGGGFVTYAEYVSDVVASSATVTDNQGNETPASTNNSGFVIGGQFSF